MSKTVDGLYFPTKLKCLSGLREQREQAVCAEGEHAPE